MKFGNKVNFSINLELDKHSHGVWMLGKFCYWIKNQQVGNYDLVVSLRDVLFSMAYIIGDKGKRVAPKLNEISSEKAFCLINKCLIEDSNDIYSYVADDFLPARFDVGIDMHIFNDWRVYLVANNINEKIIYKNMKSGIVDDVILPLGEFDSVAGEAYSYLDCLYEEQISKDK